jgi:peptidoglycan/xylan/chitin deacetylase (PgdA/CDA1 family)
MPTPAATVVPILLYHSIADQPAHGQAPFTVTPAAFREHVRAIADSGRTALTVSEYASALRGERECPHRSVLVTFDDGFADVRAAVDLLLGAGLAASVFVTTGLLGRPAMLRSRDVRDLAALDRVELGPHSVTHPRLDEVRGGTLNAEINGSKRALEDIIKAPVGSFAYPHGAYDQHVRAAVRDAGFQAAAAVKNALSHNQDDIYALARVTVTANTTARHLELLVDGSGAPLAWRREHLRTRGYRSLRRVRRRLRELA